MILTNFRDLNGLYLRLMMKLIKTNHDINILPRSCWIFMFLIWNFSSSSSIISRFLEIRMNRNIIFSEMISITLIQSNHIFILHEFKIIFLSRELKNCSRLSIHHFHDILLNNELSSSSSRKIIMNLFHHLHIHHRSRNSEASISSMQ